MMVGVQAAMDMVVGKTATGLIKVGDIFYASWGYDQTNIDFVQVESISPSGKTVAAKMMSKHVVKSEAGGIDHVSSHIAVGRRFRLMVKTRLDGRVDLAGSYPFAEGAKRMGYFSRYVRPVYQTAPGWGH